MQDRREKGGEVVGAVFEETCRPRLHREAITLRLYRSAENAYQNLLIQLNPRLDVSLSLESIFDRTVEGLLG